MPPKKTSAPITKKPVLKPKAKVAAKPKITKTTVKPIPVAKNKAKPSVVRNKIAGQRENIKRVFTEAAVTRLAKKAGAERRAQDVDKQLRKEVTRVMGSWLEPIVTFTEHEKRKTVQLQDLKAAAQLRDRYIGLRLVKAEKSGHVKGSDLKPANQLTRRKTGGTKKVVEKDENGEAEEKKVKKPRHHRPGTVAKREVKRLAKTDGLLLRMASFERYTRELASTYKEGLRFTEEFMRVFQALIETELLTLLTKACFLIHFIKRETLRGSDIEAAVNFNQIDLQREYVSF